MKTTFRALAASLALAMGALALPAHAGPSVGVAITAPIHGGSISLRVGDGGYYYAPVPAYPYGYAPPAIVERMPALAPGFVWVPGHWAWTPHGYRWENGHARRDPYYEPYVYGPPVVIHDYRHYDYDHDRYDRHDRDNEHREWRDDHR